MYCKSKLHRGLFKLLATIVCVGIVWCVVLPTIGNAPLVRDHIERLDRDNIDASALYYTDLEVMSEITARGERAMNAHPEAFYFPHNDSTESDN